MKTVYFVRHGETEGNIGRVFQGPETPLTEKGKAQARTVAKRCARLPAQVLISSTMKRARQTADVISSEIGKPVELSDLFIERRRPKALHDASADDAAVQQLEKDWRDSFFTDGRRILDAENFAEVCSRATQAFRFLEKREEDHILVVTHGFFLRLLAAKLIFGDAVTPPQYKHTDAIFRSINTGITVFVFEPSKPSPWQILVWNDHAHLG